MEVAGSKAQAGAGIQVLLQTDLNTSKLHGAIMDNGKDSQPGLPWQGTGKAW